MSGAERLYRLLLRAYPRRFRETYAGDIAEVFRDAWTDTRRRGALGRARFWIETAADVATGITAAWAGVAAGRLGLPGHTDPPDPYHPGRRRTTLADLASALGRDAAFALRTFGRRPAFAAVALATLALGIGGVTAVFGVVHGVLLEPLPYAEPDRLVRIWHNGRDPGTGRGNPRFAISGAEYHAWKEGSRTLENVVAFVISQAPVGPQGTFPLPTTYGSVTWDFFRFLGVDPHLGRLFAPDDEPVDGQARVAVLSHAYWRQTFGADTAVLGRSVIMNGEPRIVVGVLPEGFRWLESAEPVDLWIPRHLRSSDVEVFLHNGLGRTRDGFGAPDVAADLSRPVAAMAEERGWPGRERPGDGWVTVEPYHQALFGDSRAGIFLLMGAVALVLLLACVNVANLLLGQASARTRELAVRSSLGAGRTRLAAQLLVEALILAFAGSALGLVVAVLGVEALKALAPDDIPRLEAVDIDATVLAASAGVALASGVLFGLLPAVRGSRADIQGTLSEAGSGRRAGFRRNHLRSALVVGEVALALVVVSAAGLMVHSFVNLLREDIGFRTRGVWAADLRIPTVERYFADLGIPLPGMTGTWIRQTEAWAELPHRLLERLRRDPRVADAAAAQEIPLTGSYGGSTRFTPEGWEDRERGQDEEWGHSQNQVEPGFFRVLEIPLLRGRLLDEDDEAPGAPLVAVVNEALAERFWPGEDAVGKRFRGWNPVPDSTEWRNDNGLVEIVGVVGTLQEWAYGEEPRPSLYLPRARTADTLPLYNRRPGLALFVEPAPGSEGAVRDAVVEAIQAVDPELAFLGIRPLDEITGSWLRSPRFFTLLLASFGVLGALLAAVGIAGVVATLVAQRTREVGIRMAMGARPGHVVRRLTMDVLSLALLGLAIGIPGTLLLTRALESQLHGLTPTEPVTLAASAVVMAAVAALAAWLPARRAAGVDPVETLRAE